MKPNFWNKLKGVVKKSWKSNNTKGEFILFSKDQFDRLLEKNLHIPITVIHL